MNILFSSDDSPIGASVCSKDFWIGVGKPRVAAPLPPNRACGFPAHGSPIDDLLFSEIDIIHDGLFKAV